MLNCKETRKLHHVTLHEPTYNGGFNVCYYTALNNLKSVILWFLNRKKAKPVGIAL